MAKWFGYNAPFIGGNQSVLSMQVDERIVKNDLLQLLMTAPGERVMRPDFGTAIRTFLFEQQSQDALDNLRSDIIQKIEKYEPRVITTDVQLSVLDNNLNIKIYGYYNLDNYRSPSGNLLMELNIPIGKGANE